MEKLNNYSKHGVPVYRGEQSDLANLRNIKEEGILITPHPDKREQDMCVLYACTGGRVVAEQTVNRHRTEVAQMSVIRTKEILRVVQALNQIIRDVRL